jgi:LPXTG-motif cell wall-anchored protein
LRKTRLLSTIVLPAMLLSLGGFGSAAAAPASQAGPTDWTAVAGHQIFTEEGAKPSWQSLRFYPETLTINAGDTITWKFDGGPEPHTVSFLAGAKEIPGLIAGPPPGAGGPPGGGPPGALPPRIPANPQVFFPAGGTSYDGKAFTSSGVIAADTPGPKQYKLAFPTAGTYEYVCLLHAFVDPESGQIIGMKAKVVVQAAGSALPKTQAQVDTDVKAQMDAELARAKTEEAALLANAQASTPGPNGTNVHKVQVGYTVQEPGMTLDYQRFVPKGMTIQQGDTIEWAEPSPNFHNVVFGGEPEVFIVEPQPNGPPQAFVNIEALAPAGGNHHTGTGFYNSGILLAPGEPAGGLPFPQVVNYALTFDQPGRFEYICAIHYHQGMDGTVTVAARTGGEQPVGMPTTGASNIWLIIAGMVFGLVASLGGFALRARNASARI